MQNIEKVHLINSNPIKIDAHYNVHSLRSRWNTFQIINLISIWVTKGQGKSSKIWDENHNDFNKIIATLLKTNFKIQNKKKVCFRINE